MPARGTRSVKASARRAEASTSSASPRPSRTAPARSRGPTARSRQVLPDDDEDEDEEDQSRVSSLHSDDDEQRDFDSDDDPEPVAIPRRARSGASNPSEGAKANLFTKPDSTIGDAQEDSGDLSSDGVVTSTRHLALRRGPALASSSPSEHTRPSSRAMEEEFFSGSDSEEDEDEIELLVQGAGTKSRAKQADGDVDPADEEAEEEQHEDVPKSQTDRLTLSENTASPKHQSPAQVEEDVDYEGDEHFFNKHTLATPTQRIAHLHPATPTGDAALNGTSGSVAYTPASASTARAPEAPLTRLVIHKMVLRNFKSYAGAQEIGPFHKSFSSVVGPNGSGKSNVIDALLFVFGWRASKMRQGKLSELIHNSAGKEGIPSCTVEVWFREIVDLPGPDAFKVVPKSKLVIARTAYRNNSSQYTINNRKSTFTEVTTLLRGRGIDLDHKRFLILQGEVESIAQMPPKAKTEHEEGLLEYLEDIIGTSQYKAPIEEAVKLVDEYNEKRAEKMSRLKIVQKEKESLEKKKREAEQYLRDQNDLAQRQSALWQVYSLELRDSISIATQAIAKYQAQVDAEAAKHADSKERVEGLEAKHNELEKECVAIAKELDKAQKEMGKTEKERLQVVEVQKHLDAKKKKLAKSLKDDQHDVSTARTIVKDKTEEIERLQKELSGLGTSIETEQAKLDHIRDKLKDKTLPFSNKVEQKQKELQPWLNKVADRCAARDAAQQEFDLLSRREEHAHSEYESAVGAKEEQVNDLEDKERQLQDLIREKDSYALKAKAHERDMAQMREQEARIRTKLAAARAKAEEANSSAKASQTRSDILKSLARQAELGMVKGFHGRLGNLGVIDDKYDVAISTACGQLDNIVVDTVKDAQACIDHLRKANIGRANIICLDSLNKRLDWSPIETPENVPRLFDLIQLKDPQYSRVFYFALKDTLVAPDLATANRIAYGAKRWRVVTLDGQLIDKSGTMSGGGTKVQRGGMNSRFAADELTPEQMTRLVNDRDAVEAELKSHLNAIAEMNALWNTQKERFSDLDMSIDKLKMDLSVSKRRVQDAQARIKELSSKKAVDAGDVARKAALHKELAQHDIEIDKLRSKTAAFQRELDELQEKILEVGGLELRTQQSKVVGIREMIELATERTAKAEVTKMKAEQDIVRLEASSAETNAALQAMEDEFDQVNTTMKEKDGAIAAARARVDTIRDELETKQDERDDVKAELDESSDTINTYRSFEMEMKQKIEDNERTLADSEKKLQHWQQKLAGLSLHEIDDEGEDDEDESHTREADSDHDEAAEVDPKRREAGRTRDADHDKATPELQHYTEDELRAIDKEIIKADIVAFEERVQNGSANMAVLQEYKRRQKEWMTRHQDLEETTALRDAAKTKHDDLRKQRLEQFMAGFSTISAKLKEMYQTITLGGNAELELVDSLDPFSEGIIFSVMPPKKSWKNISNLSGGEKTLSSLALVFALHAFKPTPLYVMDEIDAALDFRNVSIVANIIKERTKNAQFVIISLRNNMFELSSRLVGIYKTNNCTKSICIANGDIKAIGASGPLDDANGRTPTSSAAAGMSRKERAPSQTPRGHASQGPSIQMGQLGTAARSTRPMTKSAMGRTVSSASLASVASTTTTINSTATEAVKSAPRPSTSARLLGLPHTPLRLSGRMPSTTPFTARLATADEE